MKLTSRASFHKLVELCVLAARRGVLVEAVDGVSANGHPTTSYQLTSVQEPIRMTREECAAVCESIAQAFAQASIDVARGEPLALPDLATTKERADLDRLLDAVELLSTFPCDNYVAAELRMLLREVLCGADLRSGQDGLYTYMQGAKHEIVTAFYDAAGVPARVVMARGQLVVDSSTELPLMTRVVCPDAGSGWRPARPDEAAMGIVVGHRSSLRPIVEIPAPENIEPEADDEAEDK